MIMTRKYLRDMVSYLSNVTQQDTLIYYSLNIALLRVAGYHPFPYYLQDKGVIKTVDDYTTGTIAITQGETTATITTGVVAAGMAGRKLRVGGENPYYRILSVNTVANTLTLEQPFQGTTVTAGTYAVYQDEYRLASDVDKYKMLRQAENAVAMFSYAPTRFDEIHPMPNSYADPVYEIMEGTLQDSYSTGTVSAVSGSTTLTGSSTVWTGVDGLGKLSRIRVGTGDTAVVYTVKSVDSNTQITTFETLPTIAASTSYEIILDNLRVQLFNIPNAQKLIYYRYFRLPSPLVNSYDLPDMPQKWAHLLIWGALAEVLAYKGDINKAENFAETRFLSGLQAMKLDVGSFAPDRIYRRKSIDRLTGRINYGLEGPTFDRRYSS